MNFSGVYRLDYSLYHSSSRHSIVKLFKSTLFPIENKTEPSEIFRKYLKKVQQKCVTMNYSRMCQRSKRYAYDEKYIKDKRHICKGLHFRAIPKRRQKKL